MPPLSGVSSTGGASASQGDIYSQIDSEASNRRKEAEMEGELKDLFGGKKFKDMTEGEQMLYVHTKQSLERQKEAAEEQEKSFQKQKEKIEEDFKRWAFPATDPNYKPPVYLA